MDYQIIGVVVTTCLSLVMIYYQKKQIKLMMPQPQTEDTTLPRRPWSLYWPIGVMLLLTVLAWIPTISTRMATAPVRPILRLQTVQAPNLCSADLDGSQLMRFQDAYNVYLACGIADPTIDKMKDPSISISRPFTIQPATMTVATPHSEKMTEKINAIRDQARSFPPPPKGMISFTVTQIAIWVQVVLLPKGTDTSEIHQLSDVLSRNGRVIEQN